MKTDVQLSTAQVKFLQDTCQTIAQLAMTLDPEMLDTWVRQMKVYESGSLDAVLPHQYTIAEIAELKTNFKFLIAVAEPVSGISKFARKFIADEQKKQEQKMKAELKL